MSAVKRVEFARDRVSYIILRGRWCHIIVLNVHELHDLKDKLECVFDKFPKYRMKILIGDFNAKVGREDTFKTTIWERNRDREKGSIVR
jgi:hypothetical protein